MGKGEKKFWTEDAKWGYLLIAPTVIGLIVSNIYPSIETLVLSSSTTYPSGYFELSGSGNYTQMFGSSEFWKATWNFIYFCTLTVPLGMFSTLPIVVLLNAKIKGESVFRAIYFLSMVVAPAVIAMVWKWIFNTEYGIINQMVGVKINWLTNSKLVLLACVVTAIWSAVGYDAILLLSGTQNISRSYYGAASPDNVSKVQQFFKITLSMASPTLFVVLIMRLMASIKVYDLIYVMVDRTNPVLTSAQSLIYLFHRESSMTGSRGYASAIVVWTVLLTGIITAIQFWGQKKWANYEV